MRAMRWMAAGAVAVASVVVAGELHAGKPGGGGGGTTPPGTLYFQDFATTDTAGTRVVGAMDGAGASRTSLARTSGTVRASRELHGARRWLLSMEKVAGETGPHGARDRYDVYAVRDDGALRVRLTSDPAMAYSRCDWAPDEDASGATIGMLATRWTGTTTSDTVVPGSWGFYTAHLSFDGAGDVIGLDAAPAYTVSLGTWNSQSPGAETYDARDWSWSPDMTRLAVVDHGGTLLRVVNVATGAVTQLGEGADPDWSPDNSKIACYRFVKGATSSKDAYAIETIRPDGTGRTTITSVRSRISTSLSQSVSGPAWSPDGAAIAYRYVYEDNGLNWTYSIYRVAADGTGVTNLTPEVTPPGSVAGTFGVMLVNWR